ncbi:MAG: TIGR03118 family protein [Actinomycetes bacterium]
MVSHRARWGWCAAIGGVALALAVAAGPADAAGSTYRRTNLVSDVPGRAQVTDPNLVNAWGASYGPGTPLWVSDNGKDVATLYAGGIHRGMQSINPLVVHIPGGAPTGQVFNPTNGFVIHAADGSSAPARFLFVGESGHISGWAPTVPAPAPSKAAQDAVVKRGAVYKGLAMGQTAGGPRLYAANFSSGRVEVYNSAFHRITVPGRFRDRRLPAHFAPFNVAVLGGRVYVAYARQDAQHKDEVAGPGLGRVDTFTLNGRLLHRVGHPGGLNAPWGLTIAPSGFGQFSGDLLVGNFGDGHIHAYNPRTLASKGVLRNARGRRVTIDGLWALLPGNGTEGGTDEVLFTAGPNDEAHGLLGSLALRR